MQDHISQIFFTDILAFAATKALAATLAAPTYSK